MKAKIAFFTLFVIMLISACKKEKDGNNPGQLQGSWEAFKRIEVGYKNDIETSRDTLIYDPNETVFEFRGDSMINHQNGQPTDDRFTFKLDGNELIFRSGSEGYFFAFKWYNKDQMSFTEDETSTSSSGVRRRYTSETICNRK